VGNSYLQDSLEFADRDVKFEAVEAVLRVLQQIVPAAGFSVNPSSSLLLSGLELSDTKIYEP